MSLRNQPEFEAMESETTTTTTTTTMIKDVDMTTTTETAAASAQATTAIAAAAASSALSTTTTPPKFKVAFADKNNVFDTATVEGLALSVPRVKAEQGGLTMGETELGTWIHLELISFNHRWAIGTGEEDKESKEKFKTTYDNQTISGGGGLTVADYVESLKAEGYSKAKVAPYMDLFGFITASEKQGDIPVDERQLVLVQASQTSLGAFKAFATTRGLLESRGLVAPIDVIEIHAEKRVSGTNKYTNMSFAAPKAK